VHKQKEKFVCQSCGAIFLRWQGKCDNCFAWNSLAQEVIRTKKNSKSSTNNSVPVPINEIIPLKEEWICTNNNELNQVLGKGLVKGSVVLLGGEPGIGKSTLAIQVAQNLAEKEKVVLYVSGEESVHQLHLRAKRVGTVNENLLVYSEFNIISIIEAIKKYNPELVVLDSIQVVYHPDIPSLPGSINQVRQCANELIQLVKARNITGILIGHVTKEGGLAGPKVLEHLVDVILYFEGERNQAYRMLRSYKNRFASTNEIGIFEMQEKGLIEVKNPSELFIDQASLLKAGSMVAAVAEGNRVILVEIQALVVSSGYGMAKRTFLGVDINRANLMIATIEKILGYKLGMKDIILNIIGGIRISEPALDLTIIIAIVSSLLEKPMKEKIGVIGEVGLTGEIRSIPKVKKRLIEFQKMGFSACVLPEKNRVKELDKLGMRLIYVSNLADAIRFLVGKSVE
jgi:DNA repair protein RadA/Sms